MVENARGAMKKLNEAVRSLVDHPQRYIDGHQRSLRHINATTQYEGIILFNCGSNYFNCFISNLES